MTGDLGTIFTTLSLLASLYGSVASIIGIRSNNDSRWGASARNALVGAAALLGIAVVVLAGAFITNDFGLRYVAVNSSRALPIYLKLSAVWAGQEGSLLLWSFLQALFAAIAIVWPAKHGKPLVPWATVVLGIISAFFIGVTLVASNPFAQLPQVPLDGQGLNPLLRHPGMIFHPPTMYIGYVGLAVPFAFATAALILGGAHRWTTAVRSWTLVAWLGLSLGLLLGMRWAYDVLGWGGYWGWDPVENAGLMPWFTATALLHGAVMQDERRGFRVWNHVLVTASFVLVLFGTFATRSGVIESVHAYARSSIGNYFLAAIIVAVAASMGLMVWRRHEMTSESRGDQSLLSRDGLFYLTLLIFTMLTVSVFVGSTLPSITGALSARKFEAGPDWFDQVTGPQFGALVLLIGVCPLIGRAAATMRRMRKWWWVVVVGAVAAVVGALLAGFTLAVSLVGFALAGLAAATVFVEFGEAAARRSRVQGQAPLNALWGLLRQQRRRYGGYLVHLGVVLMAVGVIGTRMYPFEQEVVMGVGETRQIGRYELTLGALSRDVEEDHVSTWAAVTVSRGGKHVATLAPRVNQYENYDQLYTVPAVQPGVREDVYLILAGWGAGGESATLKVVVNALANFLWLGGLVFLAGGALALWPQAKVRAWNAVALVVFVALLVGAGWAMWGAPPAADVGSPSDRPVIGKAAPDFVLPLVDGSAISLRDLRGQVVVLNFWATWCDTCEADMPNLVETHAAYADRGVVFVGVAYDSEFDYVAEAARTHGMNYAVGLDANSVMAADYGITGVPETFIIDAGGRLAHVQVGGWGPDRLATTLDTILGRQ